MLTVTHFGYSICVLTAIPLFATFHFRIVKTTPSLEARCIVKTNWKLVASTRRLFHWKLVICIISIEDSGTTKTAILSSEPLIIRECIQTVTAKL